MKAFRNQVQRLYLIRISTVIFFFHSLFDIATQHILLMICQGRLCVKASLCNLLAILLRSLKS